MPPALPLPPADDGPRVSGMLLIRTHHGDDDAWRDVLHRMGDLPGMAAPLPEHDAHAVLREPIPRRLIVVDDPAWQDATPEDVGEALDTDGAWVPDLVLLATDRTAANPDLRPLLAFRGPDGEAFRITPRQAALTYLVLHLPYQEMTLEDFEEWAPAEPEWEPDEDETAEDWEDDLPDPVGAFLESLNPPPRYERPARELPLLTQENDGLLVRTDFTDDAAWESLLDSVHRPGPGYDDPIDDFGDYIDALDDPVFDGATPEQLMALVRPDEEDAEESDAEVLLIADATAMRDPGQGVLVVPLTGRIGCAFRLIPEQAGIMVANLMIGNQDIEDYMDDRTREGLGA
ncbi:DUF6924 domain-containing protein [Nocardiopsis mangrovi]|uniref:DUF6924 domain-containing protein n=1 Tax=Nocardiopsis mangrovi TaxID=1179818 RepID=A0ABV9DUI5_9ACTN